MSEEGATKPAAEPLLATADAIAADEPVVIAADAIKIVFLDIDGVICCNGQGRLEQDKLTRLKKVCQETGAKVVLSTDWRRDATLKATVTGCLTDLGMTVIGATRKGPPLKPIRPQEITGWLDGYLQKKGAGAVSEWVAVDDRELISEIGGDRLKGHFVNTSFATGLTDRAADRMIAVLNGDHEQGMGAYAVRAEMARRAGAGKRTPSPARRGRAEAPAAEAPAATPKSATAPSRGGGFAAATVGGMHSSLPGAAVNGGRGSRSNLAPSAARAGGGSPARRSLAGGDGAAGRPGTQSPASAAARNAAFGRSKPGLVSPTCARLTDRDSSASAPAATPPPSGAAA